MDRKSYAKNMADIVTRNTGKAVPEDLMPLIETTGNPAAIGALARGDFENFKVAATPGGIEAQEKAGQDAMVKAFNRLPIDGMNKYAKILEGLGFTFGAVTDEIFVEVTAPAGWQLRATDHSMHSDIVDDQGRKRGNVFFKAAFYDRSASFYLFTRYVADVGYDSDDEDSSKWRRQAKITDRATGSAIAEGEWTPYRDYALGDVENDKMMAKLKELYPEHADVTAYWS